MISAKPSAVHLLLLGAGLFVFVFLGATSLQQKNNTYDEEYHLVRGIFPLRTGDFSLNQFHPPLINMLAALPIAMNPKVRISEEYKKVGGINAISHEFFWKNREDPEKMLYSGRYRMLALACLLPLLVYAWAREMFGSGAGLASFWLTVLSPSFLAHARLVTTDAGFTLFFFLAAYLFWRWLEKKESLPRFLLAGLALGAAQLTKYSALLLYPAFFLILLIEVFGYGSSGLQNFRDFLRRSGKVFWMFGLLTALSFVVILAGYGFQPMVYFDSLVTTSGSIAAKANVYFFAGQFHDTFAWWIPAVVLAIKTPLPILLLSLSGAGAYFFLLKKKPASGHPHKRQPHWHILAVCFGLPFFFFLSIMASGKGLELRYFLPVYPFLFLIAGSLSHSLPRAGKAGLMAGIVWLAAENALIYPHYLAYFNQSVGGPSHGYKYLLGSNSDWGQDLKTLGQFVRENGIKKIALSYFGRGRPDYYEIPFEILPSTENEINLFTTLHLYRNVPRAELPPRGWVAISATHLMGLYFSEKQRDLYAPFRNLEPTARIGHSILVYDMRNKSL